MEIPEYFHDATLQSISRCCDLIKIDFTKNDKTICRHIQSSLMRVLKRNDLIICSNDMYLPGKNFKKKFFKKSDRTQPGYSLYDDQLLEHRDELLNNKVESAIFTGKDLVLYLENEYRTEVFAATPEKDNEMFRVFIKGDLDSHIAVET